MVYVPPWWKLIKLTDFDVLSTDRSGSVRTFNTVSCHVTNNVKYGDLDPNNVSLPLEYPDYSINFINKIYFYIIL